MFRGEIPALARPCSSCSWGAEDLLVMESLGGIRLPPVELGDSSCNNISVLEKTADQMVTL